MYRVTIIAQGKLRERFWREAAAHYLERLRPLAKVSIVEIKEKETLAGRLSSLVSGRGFIVALDERGQQQSSEELAATVATVATGGNDLYFLIGGADGLPEEVIKSAHLVLSFSRLTYPSQLFRIMLLEQLYRVFTIINGMPYHSGHRGL
ncbi:MAG TPA: 23S rRNA (pseudouridine(1915)-N(3))-methyltransferase RlmH [Firmicutes bacterium]|nr:23S rRNA (pseudouridine(1915)-N(3))-methyltransferase RlmH [Bacillota bacterium]